MQGFVTQPCGVYEISQDPNKSEVQKAEMRNQGDEEKMNILDI